MVAKYLKQPPVFIDLFLCNTLLFFNSHKKRIFSSKNYQRIYNLCYLSLYDALTNFSKESIISKLYQFLPTLPVLLYLKTTDLCSFRDPIEDVRWEPPQFLCPSCSHQQPSPSISFVSDSGKLDTTFSSPTIFSCYLDVFPHSSMTLLPSISYSCFLLLFLEGKQIYKQTN